MRCEVVTIGTELLLGQIVDSNSSWIGEHLALASIDSLYQMKVGDNTGRMTATIRPALERSDAVICCGGLGPTQDYITRAGNPTLAFRQVVSKASRCGSPPRPMTRPPLWRCSMPRRGW